MSDINYSIRIIDDKGRGIPNSKVHVHYDMTHDSGFTDSDGWVSFRKNSLMYNAAYVKVYFRDKKLGEVWAEDGKSFSFTYNY